MRKINRKNPDKLSFKSRTLFIGNKNEVWYYTDWNTGRNYARARFEYWEGQNTWTYDEWWQLSKDDIKDEDAFLQTEKEINKFFGYFDIGKRPF